MRKLISFALCAIALLSCTRESLPVQETLDVSYAPETSKVQISGSKTVWNTGDCVSVFYGSPQNELWTYVGTNKASSGQIRNSISAYRFGGELKTALYPYSATASLNAGVISTAIPDEQNYVADSYGTAILTAVSSQSTLQFSYASSFIALGVKGFGTVRNAVLRGNNSEVLAGAVNVDVNGSLPALTLAPSAAATSITVRNSAGENMFSASPSQESYIYFCIPPMTFSNGFTVTLTFADGDTRVCRYTIPATIRRGEVLRFSDVVSSPASVVGKKEIMLDFRGGNNPFTSTIISGSTNHYRESDALASESENLPDGKTAYTKEGNYAFTIYTKYGLGSNGLPSYGVIYRSSYNYVSLGRPGSFIKMPAIPGYYLYSATYEAGSTAGTPCFASDRDGTNMVSEQIGSTMDGGVYTFCMNQYTPNTSFYLMVNSGNLTFRYFKFLYLPE